MWLYFSNIIMDINNNINSIWNLLLGGPGNKKYETSLELIGIFFGSMILSLYYLFEFRSDNMKYLKASHK